MSGTGTAPPPEDDDADDDSASDQITLVIDGEEITMDRAKLEALADRIAASPDGDGAGGLFTFMAGMPGAELAPEQEVGPVGPGPRVEETEDAE